MSEEDGGEGPTQPNSAPTAASDAPLSTRPIRRFMISDPESGDAHFDPRYPAELGQFGIPEERWLEIVSSLQMHWEMAASSGAGLSLVTQVAFLSAMAGCCLCTCGLSCCLVVPCFYLDSKASEDALGSAVRAAQEFLNDTIAPNHPELTWRCNLTRSTRSPMIEIALVGNPSQQSQSQTQHPTAAPAENDAPKDIPAKAAPPPEEEPGDIGDID